MTENPSRDAGAGQELSIERVINKYASNGIHLFLSILAVVVFAGAVASACVIVADSFPKLLEASNEYRALQTFIHDLLLVAIAGELALLLLFHRTSAAIEVIIFVIARKMTSPDLSGADMAFGAGALALLMLVRFYFVPGKTK